MWKYSALVCVSAKNARCICAEVAGNGLLDSTSGGLPNKTGVAGSKGVAD